MDDDFNTAKAIGIFNDFLRLLNQGLESTELVKNPSGVGLLVSGWMALRSLGEIIGIFQENPSEYIEQGKKRALELIGIRKGEIEEKIQERARARVERNYALADKIRSELSDKGILLEDMREGTIWNIDIKKVHQKLRQGGER